jgi:hypothetical protein
MTESVLGVWSVISFSILVFVAVMCIIRKQNEQDKTKRAGHDDMHFAAFAGEWILRDCDCLLQKDRARIPYFSVHEEIVICDTLTRIARLKRMSGILYASAGIWHGHLP